MFPIPSDLVQNISNLYKCPYLCFFRLDSKQKSNNKPSNYNKRKNQVILLMISNEANNYYYFAVKNLSELNSSGWLRGEKEAIIKGDNDFQIALDDALNY